VRVAFLGDIIVFKNIIKSFPGVLALDNVTMTVKKGEIHAIVGENGAGKSTLMNILGGELQPDSGEIILKGKTVHIPNPHAARLFGISIVYQELKLCPNLSVVENIFLGREKEIDKRLNWKKMTESCREVFKSLGVDINPRYQVRNLSIAEQQLVEIAKAISLRSEVLIMDEPNSALTLNETENLFKNLAKLKEQGVTILFISHRLEEVFKIADRISVLRDGKFLGTFSTVNTDIDEIVTLIAGKKLSYELSQKHEEAKRSDKVALEVKDLSRGRYFSHINFQLYEMEILGLYGLQGAGRTELLETIFGLEKADSGEVYVFGERVNVKSPAEAIRHGFAMVPEDRRKTGLLVNMDVKDNINISNRDEISKYGFILRKRMIETAREFVKMIEIKLRSVTQMVRNLSGGNQQKVIISRWLATKPKVFLMDELTRGIDVGAKAEIYRILRDLREKGLSILIVSSELPEVMAECDRILVMRNGMLVADFPREIASKEKVLRFALKG
jgi:ribose transport system ATP-binding protein